MAGTDLTVYIGADASAFVKGMDDAINKSTGKQGSGKFATLLKDGLEGGLSGLVSSVGQMFGPKGQLIAAAINLITEGVTKLIERAKEFRNLSYATDLTTKQLMKLETVSQATGVSLNSLAGAFHEFNKRMATAQIRGSEFNMAAAKLGLDMDKLKNRSMTAADAMEALSRAHKAGTDAATLAYYGNLLLGSSYEQLLPIIKRGTADMKALSDATLGNTDTATRAMASVSDMWNVFWNNFKAIAYESLGQSINRYKTFYEVMVAIPLALATSKTLGPEAGARYLNTQTVGRTDDEKLRLAGITASRMDEKSGKRFLEEFGKILGAGGKKIEPFGLQSAQGASQLQQMGGGDIVSAIAFTPLERIAKASEQTAENTKPKDKSVETEKDKTFINLGF